MNIGIIVYSQTGHTESVAKTLARRLKDKGHNVDSKMIEIEGKVEGLVKEIRFKEIPEVSYYDAIIFATYVEAFSLSQVMKAYLKKIDDLTGKKAVMLTTQFLPFKWMGGSRAHKQMKNLLEAKGAHVLGGEDINWRKKDFGRKERISFAVDEICRML